MASVLLPPATKLGQGYIFTGVCDSVYRGGAPGGDPSKTATATGSTHPTGMHSCVLYEIAELIQASKCETNRKFNDVT